MLPATSSAWFVSLSQILYVCVRDDQAHAPRAARRARWSWPGSPCSPAQKSSAGRGASPLLELSSASPRSAAAKYIVQKSKGETKSAKSSFNVLYEPVKYVDIYNIEKETKNSVMHNILIPPLIIVDMENVSILKVPSLINVYKTHLCIRAQLVHRFNQFLLPENKSRNA